MADNLRVDRTPTMADRQFLQLSEKWALAFDRNQWIVKKRKAPTKRGGEYRWANVAFVASRKAVLLRVLREKGAEIEPHAQDYIEAMPSTFQEWVAMSSVRRSTVGHGAMRGVAVDDRPAARERSRDRVQNAA